MTIPKNLLKTRFKGEIYYSYRTACTLLGVGMAELLNLLGTGALPWVQIKRNRHPVVPAVAIADFMRQRDERSKIQICGTK